MVKVTLENLRKDSRSGAGLRIAILDSGINKDFMKAGLLGSIRFDVSRNNKIVAKKDDANDEIGHGSVIAGIIRQKAPAAELFSVKIFDKSLSAYSRVLLAALQWSIENSFDLINLSLGTQNLSSPYTQNLYDLCNNAKDKNILIVSSLPKNSHSIPGVFSNVMGVHCDRFCDSDSIFLHDYDNFNCVASGQPDIRENIGFVKTENKISDVNAESFACAHATGLLALLKEGNAHMNWQEFREKIYI